MARFVLGLVERIIIDNHSVARVCLLCLVIGISGRPSGTLPQVICGTSPSDACKIVSKGSVFYSKLPPLQVKYDRSVNLHGDARTRNIQRDCGHGCGCVDVAEAGAVAVPKAGTSTTCHQEDMYMQVQSAPPAGVLSFFA